MKIKGFTLIEMAVVLVILGLLLSRLLIPMSEQMTQGKMTVTEQRLEKIKAALIGYAITYNRLPCSDIDQDGKEDRAQKTTLGCSSVGKEGYLPAVDLGVKRYDAWGRPFRYRVDRNFSDSKGISQEGTKDDLILKNKQGEEISDVSTGEIVALVFSCGSNGRPDPTPADNPELSNDANNVTNTDAQCTNEGSGDTTYIQDVYVENEFDDIFIWITRSYFTNRSIAMGCSFLPGEDGISRLKCPYN